MKLHVIGSSSKGNSYILETEDAALVIECGIRFLEIKKAIDFDLDKIKGVLITHSHGDHNKFVKEYLAAGITVYAHPDTIKESKVVSFNWAEITIGKVIHLGGFQILPFLVVHDVTCLGFYFNHIETRNKFPFITDTHYCPVTFQGATNIIVECNYSNEILQGRSESGSIHGFVHDRVVKSHMSLETCLKLLLANDLSRVETIVLIHLSDGNSDSKKFIEEVSGATGKEAVVAAPGMCINLGKTKF